MRCLTEKALGALIFASMLVVVPTHAQETEDVGPNATPPPQDDAPPAELEKPTEPLKDPGQFAPLSGPVAGDEPTGFVSRALGGIGFAALRNDDVFGGGALHLRGVALLFGPLISARYLERHFIGGDSAGVAYSLSAQGAIGLRWELPGNHGPFARFEARGEMQRIGGWYYSSLRVPGVQVGYGLDHGPFMLDIFGHLSPSWTGRVRTVKFTRPVEGAFTGGAFSLGWNNWLLHADASHLLGFEGGPLWDVRSSLCSYWGKKPTRLSDTGKIATRIGPRSTDFSFGICTDISSLTFPRSGEFQQKSELGLSFVVGTFSRLDRTAAP